MPYDLKYNSALRIIEIMHMGVLSGQDIRKSTDEAIALQLENGVYAVLIDSTDFESVGSMNDVYALPQEYKEGGASRLTRIALVMPRLREARKISRFYDDVCNNRGWKIQLFETRDEAVVWLASNEPS